jgi:glutamine amidotransferase
VLPGVGAFAKAMENILASGLASPLREFALVKKRPVLGVCLGMQLLAELGEEDGMTPGLGWIPGTVRRLDVPAELKVPHIGFNALSFPASAPRNVLFEGLPQNPDFYFVHSYALQAAEKDHITSFASYGAEFASSVCRGNIYGTQFHPEKSQGNGLRLLHNFARLGQA